jgi:hypothetical protein
VTGIAPFHGMGVSLKESSLTCIIREGSVSVAFGGRRLPKTMLAA